MGFRQDLGLIFLEVHNQKKTPVQVQISYLLIPVTEDLYHRDILRRAVDHHLHHLAEDDQEDHSRAEDRTVYQVQHEIQENGCALPRVGPGRDGIEPPGVYVKILRRGNGLYSLVISLLRMAVVLLPLAWVIAVVTGSSDWVWIAFPITEFTALLTGIFMTHRIYRQCVFPLPDVAD